METRKPKAPITLRAIALACGDLLNSAFLFALALILGPLGFLRGPLGLEKWFWYVWMLTPSGLLSQSIRAGIEWRLGSFDAATVYLEQIVLECERLVQERPKLRHRRIVLCDFYTLLARSYLHSGHVDDAMVVVQRAKKFLGVDRLPGLPRLDAKTAHLVRAGLAAGRLIEGGGLATLFVKSQNPVQPQEPPRPVQKNTIEPKPVQTEGILIPFPNTPANSPASEPPTTTH